jgi:hypothetical protein
MTENANFSELRNRIERWDIDAEEMLLKKIKLFTDNYMDQFSQFSKNMDNLELNLITTEVENYKAYSQLKILANNQFIEEILDKNEKESEEQQEVTNNPEVNKDVLLEDTEVKKNVINISLQNMQEIQKKKDKDKVQIEDDTVSVSSSRLNLDNVSKYVRMPFIIGTADFQKDKTLGLSVGGDNTEEDENNKKIDNDIEDPDVGEFLSNIPVADKVRKKWDKVDQERNRKKEEENIKESEKVIEENKEFVEDIKPKQPKETDSGFEIIEDDDFKNMNNINNKPKQDEYIPPPPPPPPQAPPVPPVLDQNINPPQNEINNRENIDNANPNPNPAAEPKKIYNDIKIDSFLAGADVFQDEEEDMDDGLFSRKNRKIPVIPNQMPNPNQNPNIIQNSNPHQSQMLPVPQMIKPQIDANNNLNPKPEPNINNSNLGIVHKKFKNIFGGEFADDSDDDEFNLIKPPNKNEKKEEIVPQNELIKEEKKEEEKKEEIKEDFKEDAKKDEEKKEENKIEVGHKKRKNLIIGGEDKENNEIGLEKKQSSKDKMVNSLFDLPEEDEKNKIEEKKGPENAPKANNEKSQPQKRLAFLFDEDE